MKAISDRFDQVRLGSQYSYPDLVSEFVLDYRKSRASGAKSPAETGHDNLWICLL